MYRNESAGGHSGTILNSLERIETLFRVFTPENQSELITPMLQEIFVGCDHKFGGDAGLEQNIKNLNINQLIWS